MSESEIKNIKRKAIILAGGNGTRLAPITSAISKQLLPIYDKPMIYYPISTLMNIGIKEFLIITTPIDKELFINLLGNGNKWGISIQYETQPKPEGLAQSFIIGEKFIGEDNIALILGDNLFHGSTLFEKMKIANKRIKGSTIFAYRVNDPERYGVVTFDKDKKVTEIIEKPEQPKSSYAVTGLYFYDSSVVEKSKQIKPSKRGELEITTINELYLKENQLNVEIIDRGVAWLDTGTFESLQDASSFVRVLEKRQGLKVGCPEEIAWRRGWITNEELFLLSEKYNKSGYGDYLKSLLI